LTSWAPWRGWAAGWRCSRPMDNPVVLGECLERGAVGTIAKMQGIEGLVEADDTIAGRDLMEPEARLIAHARASRRLEHQQLEPFRDLTPRGDEVLRLMTAGNRATDIARMEFMAMSTSRTHIAAVLNKLGVTSQVEAIALAHKCRWPPAIPLPPDRRGPGEAGGSAGAGCGIRRGLSRGATAGRRSVWRRCPVESLPHRRAARSWPQPSEARIDASEEPRGRERPVRLGRGGPFGWSIGRLRRR